MSAVLPSTIILEADASSAERWWNEPILRASSPPVGTSVRWLEQTPNGSGGPSTAKDASVTAFYEPRSPTLYSASWFTVLEGGGVAVQMKRGTDYRPFPGKPVTVRGQHGVLYRASTSSGANVETIFVQWLEPGSSGGTSVNVMIGITSWTDEESIAFANALAPR